MGERIRILHVTGNSSVGDRVETLLAEEPFAIERARSARDARTALAERSFDGLLVCATDPGGADAGPGPAAFTSSDSPAELGAVPPVVAYATAADDRIEPGAVPVDPADVVRLDGSNGDTVLGDRIRDAVGRQDVASGTTPASDAILDRISDAMLVLDDEWRITYLNAAAESVFDEPLASLRGERLWDRFPDARETPFYDAYHEAVEAGEPRTIEEYFEPWDRWYRERLYPDEDGLTVLFEDVTAERERERRIEELAKFREAIIQSANVWIDVVDADGTVRLWNEAAAEISGYPADAVVGSDEIWNWLYPDDDHREALVEYAESIAAGTETAREFETEIRTADGDERIISWHSRSLEAADSDRDGAVAIGIDVTERHRRETELAEKRAALERQNERLAEFASVVSHDLRNPLSVARGTLELAREEPDPVLFDEIEAAHGRMATLIDGLLALARGRADADDREPVDLGACVDDAWRSVDTGDASLVSEVDVTIVANERSLRRLLENLVRNAVEHAVGPVTVTVEPVSDGFAIADDGPGIPPAERERMFERGYTTRDGNTGFGLAIVREVADAHGWTVDVGESADGGARFAFTGVEDA